MNSCSRLAVIFFFSLSALADLKDDLYGENEAAKSFVESFVMNCSVMTPQCVERQEAEFQEEQFNAIFLEALDRDMQIWPNNEIVMLRSALESRKDADADFADGFFGNAAEQYQEAATTIAKLLTEADAIVKESIELGEEYLYQENRPDWAADYFNEALIYDPTNKRIAKAVARINFLNSFEDGVIEIEELLAANEFDLAIELIDELLLGDQYNETLLGLKKQASQGETGVKIKKSLAEFKSELITSETEEQKNVLLSKINNSISVFGINEMTTELVGLRDEVEELLYEQRFDQLSNKFINSLEPLDALYDQANTLLSLYPRNKEVQNIADQIKEKRNIEMLEELKANAANLYANEKWNDALNAYSEVSLITKSKEDREMVNNLKNLTKRLSSMQTIMNEPTMRLGSKQGINSAEWLLNELKKFSSTDTPALNKSIVDFESMIGFYSDLVSENEKMQSNQVASKPSSQPTSPQANKQSSSNTQTNKKSIASNSSSNTSAKPSAQSSTLRVTKNASLDMSSFVSKIECKKRIRNKQMVANFEISVKSSGRASNVVLINEQDLNLSSRDEPAINVIKTALSKSRYKPAKSGNAFVDATIIKKINIVKNICM